MSAKKYLEYTVLQYYDNKLKSYVADNYLSLTGGTLSGGYGVYADNRKYYSVVNGGLYKDDKSTHTGMLYITLPAIFYGMIKFTVSIYNYSSNTSVDYIISGYTYNDKKWYSVTANCLGKGNLAKLAVRFYKADSNNNFHIGIGETTTVWSYPQVTIRDLEVGFAGMDGDWLNGWNITITTTPPDENTVLFKYSDNNYLPITGGTLSGNLNITGNLRFSNAYGVKGKDSGGIERNLLQTTTGNAIYLGSYGWTNVYSYNNILPASTNNYNLGSSSLYWNNIYGTTIYENGTSLANKYLPKSGGTVTGDLSVNGTLNVGGVEVSPITLITEAEVKDSLSAGDSAILCDINFLDDYLTNESQIYIMIQDEYNNMIHTSPPIKYYYLTHGNYSLPFTTYDGGLNVMLFHLEIYNDDQLRLYYDDGTDTISIRYVDIYRLTK